jgi:hypothetical protein
MSTHSAAVSALFSFETMRFEIDELRERMNALTTELEYWVKMQNEMLTMMQRIVALLPDRDMTRSSQLLVRDEPMGGSTTALRATNSFCVGGK